MKTYRELLEGKKPKKITAASMVKMFKENPDDWGDEAKDEYYVKKGNLINIDTYYYGGDKALQQLETSWKPGGHNYDFWNKEYGVKIKIVDSFIEIYATGRHKKVSKNGIVGVVLKIN